MVVEAIAAHGLCKNYKGVRALDDVNLCVPEGTVLGLLGPNGAGKTTVVRILTTLISADAGSAHVAGADVFRNSASVRSRIGVSGQEPAVDEYLTGRENLVMFGRLNHFSFKEVERRADDLLVQFGLDDAADRPSKTYSGGMRRRLDLAAALFSRPSVLFLDEPTTGLDPRSRGYVWDLIGSLVSEGTSVLLTTQYLEEADHLADKIVVIDGGCVIAEGSASDLKGQAGGERLTVTVGDPGHLADAARVLGFLGSGAVECDERRRSVSVPVAGGTQVILAAARALDEHSIKVWDIGVRRPTLDEAFLNLTGREPESDGNVT